MLLGIALATIGLVAACVVSVVFRPDADALRPIDGEVPEEEPDGHQIVVDGTQGDADAPAPDDSRPPAR
jgi:hypothetical protein